MHLNPDCRYPDLSNLFVREDVAAPVEGVLLGIPDEIAAQRRMLEGPLPQVPIGEPLHAAPRLPLPEALLAQAAGLPRQQLVRIERKRVLEYEANGYADAVRPCRRTSSSPTSTHARSGP